MIINIQIDENKQLKIAKQQLRKKRRQIKKQTKIMGYSA